jgi:hypothetical protein
MLLDASETVLGIFGFGRTLNGKTKDKWWMELRRNKMNDVQVEAGARSSSQLNQVCIEARLWHITK